MFTAADMSKYYPALDIDSVTDPLKSTITGKLEIAVGDYNDVTWTGKTKDGKAVVIKVENAINMGNIEWTLEGSLRGRTRA